jgi:MYXO-CTERM domain-containing protein
MAATSTNYSLDPVEIDNGGGRAVGTSYILYASIGGDVIGGVASGATYTSTSDYYGMIDLTGGGPLRTLQIATGPNNPGNTNEAPGATGIPMLQVNLTTSTHDITVTSVAIHASGTGADDTGVTLLEIYHDSDSDGFVDTASSPLWSVANPFSADEGTCTLTTSRTITAGNTESWLVVYDFSASAVGTFVASTAPADFTGVDTNTQPATILGSLATGGTKSVGMSGTATISLGPANLAQGNHFPAGATGAILQFQIAADATEDVEVTEVTLRATGTANDVIDIAELRLFLDTGDDGLEDWNTSTPLSQIPLPFSADNGAVTCSFAAQTVPASGQLSFLVSVLFDANSQGGQTFGVSILNNADVDATGVVSTVSPTITGAPVGSIVSIDLPPAEEPTTVTTESGGSCASAGKGRSPLALALVLLGAFLLLRKRPKTARR